MTISVMTNTAINLVSCAEQDLFSTFPILNSPDEFLQKLSVFMSGNDPRKCERLNGIVNDATQVLAEWFFLLTQEVPKAFRDGLREGRVEITQRGLHDPKLTRMEEDQIILREALMEFFFMTTIDSRLVVDELTDGLASMFLLKNIPMWVAYAAQIFLDIHNALREDVERGLAELQASGSHIASVLKEYYNLSKSGVFAQLPAPKEPGFNSLMEIIDQWILGDTFDQFKCKFIKQSVSPPLEPFTLFRRHPLICGLFQFQLYTNLQHHSIILAGEWRSILYVAHLYEGCRP